MNRSFLATAAVAMLAGRLAWSADPPSLTKDEQRLADAAIRQVDVAVELKQAHAARLRAIGANVRVHEVEIRKLHRNPPTIPFLYLWKLRIGRIGRLTGNLTSGDDKEQNHYKVVQIIDGQNMLIEGHDGDVSLKISDEVTLPQYVRGEALVWVSGVSTEGIVDDSYTKLGQVFEVIGTKQYQTALGSKTVFEISPFPIQDTAAFRARIKPRSSPNHRAATYRTWTDATGDFTVEARFGGIISGKVTLLTKDGRKIQLEPSRLSAADQAFLKEKTGK